MTEETPARSFTGRRRQRKTSGRVVAIDRVAKSLITVGGIGTIVAVLGVFLFLLWVVLPLFLPAKVSHVEALAGSGTGAQNAELLHVGMDEYQLLGWVLRPSGEVEVFRLEDGAVCATHQLLAPGLLSSASVLLDGSSVALGRTDGVIQLAEIGFTTEILDAGHLPAEVAAAFAQAEPGTEARYRDGVVELTAQGQYRFQRLEVELGTETRIADGPVRLVRHVVRSSGPLFVALVEDHGTSTAETSTAETSTADSDGGPPPAPPGEARLRLQAISGRESSNFLTGETSIAFDAAVELPFEALSEDLPTFLGVTGPGSDVYLAWPDGAFLRLATGSLEEAYVAEKGWLLEEGTTLATMRFILGNNTLVWSDSQGRIAGGFPVRRDEVSNLEEIGLRQAWRDERTSTAFARTKLLARDGSPALALASSARSRLLLTGQQDGSLRLYNVTNASELTDVHLPVDEAVLHLVMAPKEDGLLALTRERIFHADLDPRYPETSFAGLFRPVWYEGYSEPLHTWQSSSATDDFEIKLGLMPLIFGTLKATLYSMLFGAPLALLAAIFTSEFMKPRTKAVIKPAIELMASLPSVVLGFLAALVIAPFVERIVPATLTGFLTIPLAFLLGAYLWQLVPGDVAIRYEGWRFGFIALVLPVGVLLAALLGPVVEGWLFAGDLKAWLAWDPGHSGEDQARFASPLGGWMLLLVPLAALAVALLIGRVVNPRMRRRGSQWDRRQFALADLVKFLCGFASTLVLAFVASWLLSVLGFDPRGGFVDTYVQRNALIVGFVMGFAIIPIIYTISEDALSTVPEHLRSASLGAGATRWQTATRIIIPTAMSGLFSALMIGLGRAVGETMIVLMAAGNTPVMEWNVFEGFRTLSANIAVELPEAVRNSTHYRTLFLAALVLFALTFLVNTVAEIVRLRFRKRAYQL